MFDVSTLSIQDSDGLLLNVRSERNQILLMYNESREILMVRLMKLMKETY